MGVAIHIRGSTTMQAMAGLVAQTYMADQPGHLVSVNGGGTMRGFEGVLNGTAHLGMVSGPISESLEKTRLRLGASLALFAIDYDAMIVAVHPSNPIKAFNFKQLAAIFSGRMRNWKELGGADAQIKCLIGAPSDGLTSAFGQVILKEEIGFTARADVLALPERIRSLARDPFAIGFVSQDARTNAIKPLSIEGVAATEESIRRREYPLLLSLSLVSNGSPPPSLRNFIDYYVRQVKIQKLSADKRVLPT